MNRRELFRAWHRFYRSDGRLRSPREGRDDEYLKMCAHQALRDRWTQDHMDAVHSRVLRLRAEIALRSFEAEEPSK